MVYNLFLILLPFFAIKPHPLYLSVIDVVHNNHVNNLELTCKIYTDDFEQAIKIAYKTQVDLLNTKNIAQNNILVERYLRDHLQVVIDDKAVNFNYIGYEHKEAGIWVYFEALNIITPAKIQVATNLLFAVSPKQNNIINVTINSSTKTKRLSNPEMNISFNW